MTIVLSIGKTKWHWSLQDDEGEEIASGLSNFYADATQQALIAYDLAKARQS